MTIGNILSSIQNKESKHATVLLALLPVPLKMLGVAARDAWQRQVNTEILGELMEAIFAPTSGKWFLVDQGGPERTWSTT